MFGDTAGAGYGLPGDELPVGQEGERAAGGSSGLSLTLSLLKNKEKRELKQIWQNVNICEIWW